MATNHQRHFLQDRYLGHHRIPETLQYGYVDPLSAAGRIIGLEPHFKDVICFPLCVVFAADHILAVILRYILGFFLTPS